MSRSLLESQTGAGIPSVSIPTLAAVLNDPKRLEVLEASALLDTPAEEPFDRLTRLASSILNAPVSLVSLVDKDRQFFKSHVGLPDPWASSRETPLSHSFCQHVVASGAPLIVADARLHPLLQGNEAIRDLKVIAYLGIPLTTPEGQTLGSFCTIDAQPRSWSDREIKIMQDLATFVMTEIELRLLARHFQANYLQLRTLESEREDMVQMLVHDLRNPLSSLLMGLQLLQVPDNSEDDQKCLEGAKKGAQSLLQMVNDILDASKSQAGRLSLDLSEVSVEEVITLACVLVAQMAYESEVTIKTRIDANIPPFKADREKIRRMLVNLVSNAIQHTSKKGEVKIDARYSLEKKRIIFEVADNGVGIPKEAFGKIFKKFGQFSIPKPGKVSTGLGLPFCKMAAEAHGGEISVQSEPGQGTTFRFEIPEGLSVGG